jgi:peptidoglycan hydrolase-like protein with peptidoglycan-binding domain
MQPFRAGGRGGEARSARPPDPAAFLEAHAAGVKTLAVDVSEFQPDISDAKYLNWSKAIIIRAAYGAGHDDRAWYGGQRRAMLHDGGVQFLGIYQYITAFEDVTAQAREFCRLLGGKLNAGEYPLADWEEGAGNQAGRRSLWNHVVASELGFAPGTGYSGEFFAASHGLAPVEWVAAYQAAEPSQPHLLWQFTDAFGVPGIGMADCSVYDGPAAALAAHAYGGKPAPPPPPAPPFPYPAGDYLGVASKDPHCHSGFLSADRPHVLAWQQQMAHRGWAVTASGTYDHAAEAICQQFQREKGLAADGKAGPATWAATWAAAVT